MHFIFSIHPKYNEYLFPDLPAADLVFSSLKPAREGGYFPSPDPDFFAEALFLRVLDVPFFPAEAFFSAEAFLTAEVFFSVLPAVFPEEAVFLTAAALEAVLFVDL